MSAQAALSPGLQVSAWQECVLAIAEEFDIALLGGRGSSKSHALALLALRHVEMYGSRARALYIRQTYKGLADFENVTRELFFTIYSQAARYNGGEHVWRFPNGAYMELGQLEGVADYSKYQGRSFTLLLVDEAGQYATPDLLDRLRSNLRGPAGMPIRAAIAANPGDVGHFWLASRYVFRSAPWKPFYEPKSKRHWVYVPSTYRDNPFIDHEAYRAQLEASCPADPELLRAWLNGDWSVARGAFFAGVLEEDRVAVDPWPEPPRAEAVARARPAEPVEAFRLPGHAWGPDPTELVEAKQRAAWEIFLAHDYGSSAPSVTYVVAVSPGAKGPDGRFYPRDSLVLVDELATNVPGHLNVGMQYLVPRLAEEIKAMCARWGMKPDGVADDSIFARHGSSSGSIADEFKRNGVYFREARKADRKTGWEVLRRMLADAGKLDRPGLYVSRACSYWWSTVPYLGRDPRNADDVDSRGPDHGADASRYACVGRQRHVVTSTEFRV